eukprot:s6871_g6.t1
MIHVTETSSHNDLRQLIERWDTGHARWNDALASSYGITTPKGPKDTSAPMEIDRLQKGKGKGGKKGDKGGKPKGGKGQPNSWKPSARDSKGQDKGKGKGKAQDATGRGAKLCHFCQKPGHIKANCYAWKRQQGQSVQQVEQVTGSPSSSASVISSSAGSSAMALLVHLESTVLSFAFLRMCPCMPLMMTVMKQWISLSSVSGMTMLFRQKAVTVLQWVPGRFQMLFRQKAVTVLQWVPPVVMSAQSPVSLVLIRVTAVVGEPIMAAHRNGRRQWSR